MSENKHGEPWVYASTRNLGHGFTASYVTCNEQDVGAFDNEDYANRAVLCVNTLAGIPDEEVKAMRDKMTELRRDRDQFLSDSSKLIDYGVTLKAQLDEAVMALKAIRETIPDNPKLAMSWQIKDIVDLALTRHRETLCDT